MALHDTTLPSTSELFFIDATNQTGPLLRYTNNRSADIVYNALTYIRLPVKIENLREEANSAPARPRLTVANVDLVIQSNVIQYNNFIGSEVTYTKIFNNPAQDLVFEETWIVNQKISHNKNAIVFELASILDISNVKLPRRQVLKNEFPGIGKTIVRL